MLRWLRYFIQNYKHIKDSSDLQSPLLKDPPGFLELGEARRRAPSFSARLGVKPVHPLRNCSSELYQCAVIDLLVEAGRPRQGQLHPLLFV